MGLTASKIAGVPGKGRGGGGGIIRKEHLKGQWLKVFIPICIQPHFPLWEKLALYSVQYCVCLYI